MGMNGPVLRSIEGWKEGFVASYIFLSLPLASLARDQCERCERESERLNERNSSLLSCALAIEVFCVALVESITGD